MGKLQDRLAKKTADIERRPDEATRPSPGAHQPTTMPGQLGAFRLEVQRYQSTIESLEAKLENAKKPGSSVDMTIPLRLIDDSPYQPRLEYDPEKIDALAKTMAQARQADPIKVRQVGERYELISGHRRVRAARTLGWEEIDAIIEIRSDADAEVEAMLLVVGNVELTDFELAKMFDRAITAGYCKNQSVAATFFGYSAPKVSGCMDLLRLPTPIVSMLENKPSLFGYECGKLIKGLLKGYPEHGEIIEQGVQKIAEGMKQSQLKGWVLQAIKHESSSPHEGRKTITKRGHPVFTTKADAKSITVNIKLHGLNIDELEKNLSAWLQEQADNISDDLIGVKKK